MENTKVSFALFAGLAAGAVLGIIFAPQTGTDTRGKLSESLANLGDSVKDSASEQIKSLVSFFKTKEVDRLKSANTNTTEIPADDLEHA